MTPRLVYSQSPQAHDPPTFADGTHRHILQQSLAIAWRELFRLNPKRREDAATSALLVKAVAQYMRLGERHPQRLALNALSALSICDND